MVWLGESNGLAHAENVAYAAMSLCFAISLGLTIVLRPTHTLQSRNPEPIFTSLSQGIDFMLSQRVMLGAFTMDLFAVLLGGAVALLPIFADMLQVGAFGFGLLRAASSIGAVLMSLYLIVRPPLAHAGPTLYGSFAVFAPQPKVVIPAPLLTPPMMGDFQKNLQNFSSLKPTEQIK
jgi:hypothetical protein